jgi:hypothetical protein
MTVQLHVGAVGGTGDLTPNSMAAAIYDALASQVPLGANEDRLPRQKLAIAIAAGVIGHLQGNAGAFHLNVSDSGVAIDRSMTIEVG